MTTTSQESVPGPGTPPGEMISIEDLPPFLRGHLDLDNLYCDLMQLRELANINTTAFQHLMATSETDKAARESMAATIYLQQDLLDLLAWRVNRLTDSHRLVHKIRTGASSSLVTEALQG